MALLYPMALAPTESTRLILPGTIAKPVRLEGEVGPNEREDGAYRLPKVTGTGPDPESTTSCGGVTENCRGLACGNRGLSCLCRNSEAPPCAGSPHGGCNRHDSVVGPGNAGPLAGLEKSTVHAVGKGESTREA